MGQSTNADRYLNLFDELDTDNIEDRRIGVHLLINYFSTVLTEVATEKLGSSTSVSQDYLNKQWTEVLSKFDSIPGQFQEDLQRLPYQLAEARNPITHNDRYDPRQDINDLERIREQAPKWRSEVEDLSKTYFHEWENQSPKEALFELAKQNLRIVQASEPKLDDDWFKQDYKQIWESAANATEELEKEVDMDKERIELTLVKVVKQSQTLRTYLNNLQRDEEKYADHMANEVRDQIEGR